MGKDEKNPQSKLHWLIRGGGGGGGGKSVKTRKKDFKYHKKKQKRVARRCAGWRDGQPRESREGSARGETRVSGSQGGGGDLVAR